MDPSLGIFMGIDPFVGLVLRPLTLHKYLYVQANPVNLVDSSGEITGIANIAVTGALISAAIGGLMNAIGASSLREFADRFLIGAMATPGALTARWISRRFTAEFHNGIFDVAIVIGGAVLLWQVFA